MDGNTHFEQFENQTPALHEIMAGMELMELYKRFRKSDVVDEATAASMWESWGKVTEDNETLDESAWQNLSEAEQNLMNAWTERARITDRKQLELELMEEAIGLEQAEISGLEKAEFGLAYSFRALLAQYETAEARTALLETIRDFSGALQARALSQNLDASIVEEMMKAATAMMQPEPTHEGKAAAQAGVNSIRRRYSTVE
jgi:hypothetical protein